MPDPIRMSHEDAIQHFLTTVGPELVASHTVRDVILRFTTFYAQTRIDGTDLECDEDMFCIETGFFDKIVFPNLGITVAAAMMPMFWMMGEP